VSSGENNLAVKNMSAVDRKSWEIEIDSRVGGAGEASGIEKNRGSATSDAV
jgi:hypothetical protein